MFSRVSYQRYLLMLGLVFAFAWTLLAIEPIDRGDWALENALVVVVVLALIASHRVFPLSRLSYTLIFIFLMLHEIGAHYTYALVPYDNAFRFLFGFNLNEALGFERNHFDRAMHFVYGLLLAYPIREVFIRIVSVRGFWGYFLPLVITLSTSLMFELFEWGAVEYFGGDLGVTYLGSQGDVWDAQKDMALASLGAIIAMLMTAAINRALRRDFAAEWSESLRVKIFQPLGENELKRIPKKRRR
jgi:putative membrane protein